MHFQKLDNFIATPPFPMAIAVLIIIGIYFTKNIAVKIFNLKLDNHAEEAATFIITSALIAALIYLLALLNVAYITVVRFIGCFFILLGMLQVLCVDRKLINSFYYNMRRLFYWQNYYGKVAIIALCITIMGLLLSSLAPPTDADSLDYHLGVPLDILRHHGVVFRYWYHARLVGLGESLNMLGLATGTDILGATFQFTSVLLVLFSIMSLAKTKFDKILVAMAVVGCPVLAFLVPNQKPQMLPTAATTIAIILIAKKYNSIDVLTLSLAFGCAFFAMACKYSFILSGSIVVALGFAVAYRSGLTAKAIAIALIAYLILVFPVHLHNFLFYGDPISPFLERFKENGDVAVINFASFLRGYSDNASNFLPVPLSLMFPSSMGEITTTLGLGSLLIIIFIMNPKNNVIGNILLITGILSMTLTLFFGQVGGRFVFEAYLWIIAAVAITSRNITKTIGFRILVCQIIIMAFISSYGAIILFPGALTINLRDKVMASAAHNYSATVWLDKILPPDAVIFSGIRSNSLMPREFVSRDEISYINLQKNDDIDKILGILKSYRVNTLVAAYPVPVQIKQIFGKYIVANIDGPKEFAYATRNPWNKNGKYQLIAYRLNLNLK